MNHIIRTGALLCAFAMLSGVAVAEEKHLGDYIYVPAMTAPGSVGAISLRVSGARCGEDGQRVEEESLAGAEFGVYVVSSDGQLRPWANPLLPSEPMRIRTGEGETRFTLPQGTEFYLRQERAPQGYCYDREALIPVTGGDIVVNNEMAGELRVRVQDSLGNPLAGVTVSATNAAGEENLLITDENGAATMSVPAADTFAVREATLPEGVFDALAVYVGGAADSAQQVAVGMASRTEVVFEHPAAGAVQLQMTLAGVGEDGEPTARPLSGVTMEIVGQTTLVTDEAGVAQASLLEGTYDLRFAYAGDGAVLPLDAGQMIVQSGATTVIELSAAENRGRVVMQAVCERDVSGGEVTFVSEETGETFGPYAFDADGLLVSDAMPVGSYRIGLFAAPGDTQAGRTVCGDAAAQPEAMTLAVAAGQATHVMQELLTIERQTFALLRREADDAGRPQETALGGALRLTLVPLDGQGEETIVEAKDGAAALEALSGSYALRMEEKDAKRLGVVAQSDAFTLPARAEAVAFADARARVIVRSVDENGVPVAGAQYTVTDASGAKVTVTADENGEAVTPALAAGEATVATKAAPEGHDAAADVRALAVAGEAAAVQMTHETYGTARFAVQMQALDASGRAALSPAAGVRVRLYRVEEGGQRMTDTGVELVSGEDGAAAVSLAPGEYAAQVQEQTLDAGCRAPQALRFAVQNMQESGGDLVCLSALGGVRARLTGGTLNDEQLAQVRFELLAANGQTMALTMQDGAFYAGDLAAGTYVLRQTQMPQGYTLASERTVSVAGGEAATVDVPLEEYAVLSVSKTGLTFNDQLQTYVVPLTGEYGVYTMEGGEMKPYPSASAQATVWANAAPQAGKAGSVRLPAAVTGTTYYLMERGGAAGFAKDTNAYEVTLTAGETRTLECAVSSDRGFFSFSQIDAATGAHVPGGSFELLDGEGERVLAFTLGDAAYRNAMALPVGGYTLRQTEAAPGYALSYAPEAALDVPPYLTQGGNVAFAQMTATALPQDGRAQGVLADVYAGSEQGLTLLTVDAAALPAGETVVGPRLEIAVSEESGARVNIAGVVLSGATDAQGSRYRARVEYGLTGGGWQPSDARLTDVLDAPQALSLADVQDDVDAIRVTYLNADTGEEVVGAGFAPGRVSLNVQAGVAGEAKLHAEAAFAGSLVYQTAFDGEWQAMARMDARALDFAAAGNGPFGTVSAGRDGRISGVAFFDADANGLMGAQETERYAGLNVSLVAQSGEVVGTVRTGADGRYAFDTLSAGVYTVEFDAGENVIFSRGDWFSDHVTSGVADTRYGVSAPVSIDGDHTDYVVNAGCIYAGEVVGSVQEVLADGTLGGMGGLNVEMRRTQRPDDEPSVVMTGDLGDFAFTGVLPGEYELALTLPEGYLCEDAADGVITRVVTIEQGDSVTPDGAIVLSRAVSVSGAVRVDDDGDGVVDAQAETLSGVRVVLLRAQDGHTDMAAETVTDENGAYRFDGLYAGEYSVLFELEGEWAFTRYGADSAVYGAVSQSGSTKSMTLLPGESAQGVNAAVTIPAQLSVSVFKDTQADGQKGVYEEMLAGVSVSLIRQEDGQDAEAVTYKTDEEGTVTFAGVSPGEYVIGYQMPGQWRATKQVDPSATNYPVSCVPQSTLSSGRSAPFTLTMGQSGVRMTIGAMLSGSISGVAYYDDDADAQLGGQEAYVSGMLAELLNMQDDVIAQMQTGADGSYAFEGLAPGRYRVRFTAPDDCGFSGSERSMARGGVQESAQPISTTRIISVSGGSATDSADAGVVRMGALSGVVWEDLSGDGLQQDGERGMAGVAVHLMNGAGRNILDSTQTDENGAFAFDRVAPGDYKLRMDAPEGYVFSAAAQNSALLLESERDGRGYTPSFTLLGGARVENVRFGLLTQGVIGGRVWLDTDYDGRMGDGEAGMRAATVELLDANGETVAQEQTVRSGAFAFDKLMPGAYSLRVTLEEGYVFTVAGGDSLVARSDDSTAELYLGKLAMGETMADVTIGALLPARVGGVVWYDRDNDGRRQANDAGVPGAKAVLTMISGPDEGKTYETAADEDGAYRFDGVMPGLAQIELTLPDGLAFAKNAAGTRRVSRVPQADALTAQTDAFAVTSGADTLDVDAGAVGVGRITGTVWEDERYDGKRGMLEAGVPGARIDLVDAASGRTVRSAQTDETGAYTLDFVRAGEYAVAVTLPGGMLFTCDGESAVAQADTDSAQTERFALKMGEGRERLDVGAIAPAGVYGRVTVDENEDGAAGDSEAGLSGAVVTLMQGGTVVANTKTDADGAYSMPMLRPGEYRLRIALPEDTLFARGAALELAHEDAQEGQTKAFTLDMGQQTTFAPVAAVYAGTIEGRAWADANADGVMDAEEAPLGGVTAELLDGTGETIARADVDEDGRYAFRLLRSGAYAVRFTLPEGELFADRLNQPGASSVDPVEGRTAQTAQFPLAMGERLSGLNVGGIQPGRMGDTVWLDGNGNGLQDYREGLLPGVSLTLLRVLDDGQLLEAATAVSDEYGYYAFDNLRPGSYVLRLDAQPGDVLTFRFGAPLGEIDSDLDPDTAMSDPIRLQSGQILRNIDVGLTERGE